MQVTSSPNFNNLVASNFVLESLSSNPGSPVSGRLFLNNNGDLTLYDGAAFKSIEVYDSANGLQTVSGNVELGGTLSKPTTISGNSNSLSIENVSLFSVYGSPAASYPNTNILSVSTTVALTSNFTLDQGSAVFLTGSSSQGSVLLSAYDNNLATHGDITASIRSQTRNNDDQAFIQINRSGPPVKSALVVVDYDRATEAMNAEISASDNVVIGLSGATQASNIFIKYDGLSASDVGKSFIMSDADGNIKPGYPVAEPQAILYGPGDAWQGASVKRPIMTVTPRLAGKILNSGKLILESGNTGGAGTTVRIIDSAGTVFTSANLSVTTTINSFSLNTNPLALDTILFLEHVATSGTAPEGGNVYFVTN